MISYWVFLSVITLQLISFTTIVIYVLSKSATGRHAPADVTQPASSPVEHRKGPRVRSPMRSMFEPEEQKREER